MPKLNQAVRFSCAASEPVRDQNDGKQVFSAGLSGAAVNRHFGA